MHRPKIDLDGKWELIKESIAGEYPPASEPSKREVSVPAPWQSQGEDLRHFTGPARYERSFELPEEWKDQRVILHFGAVDYFAEVWINDKKAGAHEGGYLPFELDISPLVHEGTNKLVVRVSDPPEDFSEVPHGKQSWYGLLSGIWQSVWLESRPDTYIQSIKITPYNSGHVDVELCLSQKLPEDASICLAVLNPVGEPVCELDTPYMSASFDIPTPELWDLDAPRLYTLVARIESDKPDEIRETFGFRQILSREGKFFLNDQPIYLRAALDQDYYPGEIYTPPSLEYIEDEFRKAKAMGLNCLRVHIKIADPRYYQAADRIGLLIWTELPNWHFLTENSRRRGLETLRGMIDRDWNHPSIIIWTVINESWGVNLTDDRQRKWLGEMYDHLKVLDPLRLVVGNSACWGNFQVVTDVEDFHYYAAIPDHYLKWKSWVRNFASRPPWAYARVYQDYRSWKRFSLFPWRKSEGSLAPDVRRRGDEPLLLSEFGNWGLPDLQKLYECYGGEPWWFETGSEWEYGVVYPHGIEERFKSYYLDRRFSSLASFTAATRSLELEALRYEIGQIRRHSSLQGYVITEFTDLHWECNGLLDMCRNYKIPPEELSDLNADDFITPEVEAFSYWEGEPCQVEIYLSHYSNLKLNDCRLEWELEEVPEVRGVLNRVKPQQAGSRRIGRIDFPAPFVERNRRVSLQMELVAADGHVAARNRLSLFIYKRETAAPPPVKVYSPELDEKLRGLGYQVVDDPELADVIVAVVLTDEHRNLMLVGKRVVWLAEHKSDQQTHLSSLKVYPRYDTPWQGDWASSFTWLYQDHIFQNLPVEGLVDFALADLTPETVLIGARQFEFAHSVHAALAIGWLHRTVPLVIERPFGDGRLLASTFRLSSLLDSHPAAALMMADLIRRSVG
jgi:hypothetical protein